MARNTTPLPEPPAGDRGFDFIHVYTRANALADGVLVDLSQWGHEAGFTIPVACTASVWADIKAIPARRSGIESVSGRGWDICWMACMSARRHRGESEFLFPVHITQEGTAATLRTYKLHIGPGDDGEPVLTILQPEED